jgi:hypothetical protein
MERKWKIARKIMTQTSRIEKSKLPIGDRRMIMRIEKELMIEMMGEYHMVRDDDRMIEVDGWLGGMGRVYYE